MTSGHALFTLVPLTMLLLPVAGLCWRVARSGNWGLGWPFIPGALLFLGMGVFCLCFRFHATRSVFRSEGRLAVVDRYSAPLFNEWTEPFHVPASAYVTEEQKKFHSRSPSTYTSYEVHVGAPGQSRRLEGFRERAEAQALVDAVDALVKGETARMELRQGASSGGSTGGFDGVRTFMGAVGYLAGLGLVVLASLILRPDAARR